MIIAKEKKKENIGEYILYMWQIEDLIRANNFDIESIDEKIIQKFDQPDNIKNEMKEWYSHLIQMMKKESILKNGHLQFVKNTLNDIYNTHIILLKSTEELEYIDTYNKVRPDIQELLKKSKGSAENEIEAGFNGLYGLLLLRLQGKNISSSTNAAILGISKLIAMLSKKYIAIEKGEIEL
ncbi:MAG: DUF4924 family protein [Bacteroidales bacterium]|jgi:hypothetical protein|nr:DUF4924 family protein [Bacteroidales bacterium]